MPFNISKCHHIFLVLNRKGHRYTKLMHVIGADQGVGHISHRYRYTLQCLQDLEKPIQVISEFSYNYKPTFWYIFCYFYHFYQHSRLLKLMQNTPDVLLLIINNLSLYTDIIGVIFYP